MNQIKKLRLCYAVSAVMLFILSVTFLIMPAANMVSQRVARIVLVSVGVLFWISSISGYMLLFVAYKMERRMNGKDGVRKRNGLFPASRVMIVSDIVFIGGVVALIAFSKKSFMQGYGAYVVLFVTTMAFHLRLLSGSRPGRRMKSNGNVASGPACSMKQNGKKDARKEDVDHE